MDFSKYTIKSQEAVQNAQQLAMENQNQQIETGHLLKAIFNVDENVTPYILKKLTVNFNIVEQALDRIIASYPKVSGGQEYLSRNANMALQKAQTSMKDFGDEFVSIEHLLIGLLTII